MIIDFNFHPRHIPSFRATSIVMTDSARYENMNWIDPGYTLMDAKAKQVENIVEELLILRKDNIIMK